MKPETWNNPMFNYTNYQKHLQLYIRKPETVQEAAIHYNKEKKHAKEHSYFCYASLCIYHYHY